MGLSPRAGCSLASPGAGMRALRRVGSASRVGESDAGWSFTGSFLAEGVTCAGGTPGRARYGLRNQDGSRALGPGSPLELEGSRGLANTAFRREARAGYVAPRAVSR